MNTGIAAFWRRPRQWGFMSLMKLIAGPMSCDVPVTKTVATAGPCTRQYRLMQTVYCINSKTLQISKAVHMSAYTVYSARSQSHAEPGREAAQLHNTFRKCAPYAPD